MGSQMLFAFQENKLKKPYSIIILIIGEIIWVMEDIIQQVSSLILFI
jgi:hypothetical protein